MKIGIVYKPYNTVGEPFKGGMCNFVYLQAKYLSKLGHQVTVFTGKGSRFSKGVNTIMPEWPISKIDIYRAGDDFYKKAERECKDKIEVVNASFGELSARFDRKIESFLKFFAYARAKKFDVLHIVTHDILALYPALFASIPCMISFHGHYKLLGPDFLRWLEFIKKEKGSAENCAWVSVSKYIQKEYSRYVNTRLINNAIEVKNFKPIYKKQGYLAFLARIDWRKGLDFAIDFSRRYKIPLFIGGNAEDKIYFEKIKKGIDDRLVKYLGPQNETQKSQLLGNARALIMPSRYNEAFGRVTAEALACATPVIAFDKGANPELVINGKTGYLIKENDFESAKKAWDNIGRIDLKFCRKFAKENFDIEKQIKEYEKLYKTLIN